MIGKYYNYKCEKCGYEFTKYQSDALVPVMCQKCKGSVRIKSSSMILNPLDKIKKMLNILQGVRK